MSTPHEVTAFPISSMIGLTTQETKDRVLDEIDDAYEAYKRTHRSTYSHYKSLTTDAPQEQTPSLDSFTPASHVVGDGTPFTVTVHGSHFTAASVISWDSSDVATTYVDQATLTASVPTKPAPEGVPVYVKTAGLRSQTRNFKFTEATGEEPEPEPEGTPDQSWLKADIVAWLLENDVLLKDTALANLTKAELLNLVEDLLSPAPPE